MREIYSRLEAVVYVFNQVVSEHALWSCPASGNKSSGPAGPRSWFKKKMYDDSEHPDLSHFNIGFMIKHTSIF